MPSVTIPLVGEFNQRMEDTFDNLTSSPKDQIFTNCIFDVIDNKITQSRRVYASKRTGAATGTQISGTDAELGLIRAGGVTYSVFGGSGTNVFKGSTNIGFIGTGVSQPKLSTTIIDGSTYVCFIFPGSPKTGWFYVADGFNESATATFTANRTSGSPVLTSVSSFNGIYVGQALSGDGIPAGARVQSMDVGASTITMGTDSATAANATSGAGTGTTVTRTAIAKIIDVNFPSDCCGNFAFFDGYAAVGRTSGSINHSSLNTIVTWPAANTIKANRLPDGMSAGVFSYKDKIVALCDESIEIFYNAGNPSGSVLSRETSVFYAVGAVDSAIAANDTIYWISTDSGGGNALSYLNGFSPTPISHPVINQAITTGNIVPTLSYGNIFGHKFLFLNFSAYIVAYQLDVGIPSLWTLGIINANFTYAISAPGDPYFYFADNGYIYTMRTQQTATYQDASNSFSMKIQTAKTDLGEEKLKTYSKVSLMGSDIQSSGTALLEFSDDDYVTWETAGTFDLTKNQPVIYRCKAHRGGRAWRLTHSTNTAFRASALKFEYKVGKH